MKDETKCLHAGYQPENGGPRVVPIVQSTTYGLWIPTEHIGRPLRYAHSPYVFPLFQPHL